MGFLRKLILRPLVDVLVAEVSAIDDTEVEVVKAKIVALIHHLAGV